MKHLVQFSFLLLVISCSVPTGSVKEVRSDAKPITHESFTGLLQKYVDQDGFIDYKSFVKDTSSLNQYLEQLSAHHPNSSWTEDERKAYWINTYNAFTLKLVLKHYPVASIKDVKKGIPMINTVWYLKFITIEGVDYSLNDLEHNILRPRFGDPRIHFAINCASISCPKLQRTAFEALTLDEQLNKTGRDFVNDSTKNNLSDNPIVLSPIFSWFRPDFPKGDDGLIAFLNQFASQPISSSARIKFGDYNWSLNEK